MLDISAAPVQGVEMSTEETTLSYPIECDEQQKLEMEAYAFRKLVKHLQNRTDVQNIDLMGYQVVETVFPNGLPKVLER